MLKHNDIIEKLTVSQKVRLLTSVGSLSGKDFKILGIEGVSVRNMKDYARDTIPSFAALSHSWSREVFYDTALARANMLLDDGAGFAIAPGAKIKLSPFRKEASEDPYLSSVFSEEHMRAAKDAGLLTGAAGYYLTAPELDWLDKLPSERVLNEMISRPYSRAIKNSGADGVITDERTVSEAYKRKLPPPTELELGRFTICQRATEENTVFMVSSGVICLEGSSNALDSALTRYNKFMSAAERGESVTPEQIAEMQSDYSIISPEDVDRALDTLIDFLEEASAVTKSESARPALSAKESVIRSAVLLKNKDKILPLIKERSVAVIGDVIPEDGGEALARELSDRSYRCIGFERGYGKGIDENLARANAVALAKEATTVILLLGFGRENENSVQKTESASLPAEQIRLAHAIQKTGKRIIGVIASGHTVDVEFTRDFKALITMPLYVKSSAPALAEIISGERCPEGKLAYTLYAGSDEAFKKRSLYREKYGLMSGPFVGYRYYTTANISVGYPFGHGLSYSSFRYSALKVTEGAVSFTIQNVGDQAATETVQLYV